MSPSGAFPWDPPRKQSAIGVERKDLLIEICVYLMEPQELGILRDKTSLNYESLN